MYIPAATFTRVSRDILLQYVLFFGAYFATHVFIPSFFAYCIHVHIAITSLLIYTFRIYLLVRPRGLYLVACRGSIPVDRVLK